MFILLFVCFSPLPTPGWSGCMYGPGDLIQNLKLAWGASPIGDP